MSTQIDQGTGWAVITGASSGFGGIFADQLAKRGLSLLLAGRDEPRLNAVAQRVRQVVPGIKVELVAGDLGTDAGIDALVARLDGRVIEVLVNNAGFGTYGRFSELDADREHELIAVNVDALVRLTHAVLPGMLARGRGSIVNVASTISFQPGPYQATYGASKAFVLSLSQALWAETRGSGVTVTALCPGPTRTGFVDALGSDVSHTAIYRRLAAPEPRRAGQAGRPPGDLPAPRRTRAGRRRGFARDGQGPGGGRSRLAQSGDGAWRAAHARVAFNVDQCAATAARRSDYEWESVKCRAGS